MRFSERAEIKIAIIFLLLSTLWIVFSDRFFLFIGQNLSVDYLTTLQTSKGIFYICAVTIMIFVLVKRSNGRLLRSREQYKMFFEDNPNPMMIFDTQTLSILRVNNAAINKYGYSEDEFLSMTIRDLRSEEEARKLEHFIPTLPKNNFSPRQWQHIRKNGSILEVMVTSCATTYNNNDKCRLVLIHDISEMLDTRKQMEEREKLYSSLVDTQSNYLVRIDPLGNFSFTNQSFVTSFVPEPEKEIPFKFVEILQKGEEIKFWRALADSYKNPQKIVSITLSCISFHGSNLQKVYWELKAITDTVGQVIELQCVGFDISEKKRGISVSASELEKLIACIASPALIVDQQNIVVGCNSKMEKLLKKNYIEIVSQRLNDIAHGIIPDKGGDDLGSDELHTSSTQFQFSLIGNYTCIIATDKKKLSEGNSPSLMKLL